MKARARRGFTLIEVMVVVAIIGVMTSLSVVGYQSVTRNARTNGEADVLGTFLKNARLRAVASGCAHVVRYNGANFATSPATLTLYRKGTCGVTSASLVFDTTTTPPDIVVNTYQLPKLVGSMSVTTVALGDLVNLSLMVGYGPDGVPVVASKSGGTVTPQPNDQRITLRARPTEAYFRDVVVTGAGDVTIQ